MDLKRALLRKIDTLSPEIAEVSRFIHHHPELGFEEHACSRFLAEELALQGFQVDKPLKSLPTAFRASCRGRKGPGIGFIAEYDALPDIGHGCGHNLIAASAFGAAAALAPFLKETGGSLWVFGTPAEEYGSGKVPMLKAGVFKPVDAVIMMHPESFFLINTTALALDALKFEFRGRSTHASATPHEGINALDAVIGLFNGIGALRQQLKPDARVHGIITKGGTAPNVIPDLTEAQFYIRARERRYLDEATRKVVNCAKAAALATGCRLKVTEDEPPLDDVVNNPVLAGVVGRSLKALGIRDIAEEDTVPGSADIGNVSHRIPTVYFYCATAPKGLDLHSKEFADASISDAAHQGLVTAVKAMALSALELLLKPGLVKEARLAHRG